MTLVRNLFIIFVIGLAAAIAGKKWLWPTPEYVGDYTFTNKQGFYTLRFLNQDTAVLVVEGADNSRFAFRGVLDYSGSTPQGEKFIVTWKQQRDGDEWVPLQKTVADHYLYRKGQVIGTKGNFSKKEESGGILRWIMQ